MENKRRIWYSPGTMSIEEIRDMLRTAPFKPFTLELDNGRRITVQHSETVAVPRRGRFFVVTGAHIDIIEPTHVSSIVVEKPTQKTRKGETGCGMRDEGCGMWDAWHVKRKT